MKWSGHERQGKLVAGFSWVGFFVLLIFGVENAYSGHYLLASWELGLAALILVNMVVYYFLHKLELTALVSATAVGTALLMLYVEGGIGRTGYLWYYTFPVVTFYLFPRRWGYILFWALVGMTGVLWITSAWLKVFEVAYNGIETRQLLISYLVVGLLVAYYQRESEAYEQDHEVARLDLEDAITNYKIEQDKVAQANAELTKSQAAMLNLLEDQKELELALKTEKEGIEQQVRERTRELSEERAELLAVINSISRGLIVVDREKNILLQNDAIETIIHRSGRLLYVQVAEFLQPAFDLDRMVTEAYDRKQEVKEEPRLLGNRYLVVHAVPVMHVEEVGAVAIFVKDVTETVVMERSRDEFFSIASHELRTPLTAIRGNAEMIIDKYRDQKTDQELHEMLSDIHTGSVRLIEIVNDFLNVSRLEMGKMQYKLEGVALHKLVSEVIGEMESVRPSHDVKLELNAQSLSGIVVKADHDRLKQVLINLVGNALKFTSKGGVRVEGANKGKEYEIRVVDTGEGIAKEQQGLLFHKFQQAGSSLYTRDTSRGTGLGLYIAKLMVEGMGGKIYLVDSQVGQGSTFGISLSKVKA